MQARVMLGTASAVATVTWQCLAFDALTTQQLYAILQLRSQVFVVEQNCVFQDIDGADVQAMHVLGFAGDTLVAYARCFAAGVKFAEASIGRVITQPRRRGTGLGLTLMQQSITCVQQRWGVQPIRIGAQAHLESFYGTLGFIKTGAPYMEDGIPHIEMLHA
jgi:ElaA protein